MRTLSDAEPTALADSEKVLANLDLAVPGVNRTFDVHDPATGQVIAQVPDFDARRGPGRRRPRRRGRPLLGRHHHPAPRRRPARLVRTDPRQRGDDRPAHHPRDGQACSARPAARCPTARTSSAGTPRRPYAPMGTSTTLPRWRPVRHPARTGRAVASSYARGTSRSPWPPARSPRRWPPAAPSSSNPRPDTPLTTLFAVPHSPSRPVFPEDLVRSSTPPSPRLQHRRAGRSAGPQGVLHRVPPGSARCLLRLAADNVLKSSMELGGNAPLLVFDDADLDGRSTGRSPPRYATAGPVLHRRQPHLRPGRHCRRLRRSADRAPGRLAVGHGLDPGVGLGPVDRRGP